MLSHDIDCSNGLLATDIALIAVNETHAVFSIRVERAKLAEYHFFLNVISDVASSGDELQLPAPAPAPKINRLRAAAAWWGSWIRPKKPAS
jgi:hypothetical protein